MRGELAVARARDRRSDVSPGGGAPVGDAGFELGVPTGVLLAPLTPSLGLLCMSERVI